MQFPNPWLSEILKPLSDAILVNSSDKVALLFTVLAQSCIRWRFRRVRSSSPGSKIILGAFPRIIQCRWNRKSQLSQRKKIHHIYDRIFSLPWIFLTYWELFQYHHWKLRETCIWSRSALMLTASEVISAQIRAERDTYVWKKISWEHKLIGNINWQEQALLSATRKT